MTDPLPTNTLVDLAALRATIAERLTECNRALEGVNNQGDEDTREERRDLWDLQDALRLVERFAQSVPKAIRPAHEPGAEIIRAQHEETGRMWEGRRDQIPRRYFEVPAPPPPDVQPRVTYSQACALLAEYHIALSDRECCGDEMQPQYIAALNACLSAMGHDRHAQTKGDAP